MSTTLIRVHRFGQTLVQQTEQNDLPAPASTSLPFILHHDRAPLLLFWRSRLPPAGCNINNKSSPSELKLQQLKVHRGWQARLAYLDNEINKTAAGKFGVLTAHRMDGVFCTCHVYMWLIINKSTYTYNTALLWCFWHIEVTESIKVASVKLFQQIIVF